MKQRNRCPVCRIDRTYEGPVCPQCHALGYVPDKKTGRIRRRTMNYLPAKIEMATVNVRIEKSLKINVENILKGKSSAKKKIGWAELIHACLNRFVDEEKE